MQHITKVLDDTHDLLNPRPVEPFERTAAGLDEPLTYDPGISVRALLVALAVSLLLWTAIIQAGAEVVSWMGRP